MALILTDQDLNDLQSLIGDFRHKDAMALIQFMAQRQRQQQVETAKPRAPQEAVAMPAMSNGHDEQAKAPQHAD